MRGFDAMVALGFLLVAFVALASRVDPAIPMGCMLASLLIVRTRR